MNLNATLIGQLIAFALFVWFCMKFVWPPIINAIETRQSQIANALASAEAAKKEQADTKNLVEQELSAAKLQAQDILDAANKRRNEVLDEVKAEAEELKARWLHWLWLVLRKLWVVLLMKRQTMTLLIN